MRHSNVVKLTENQQQYEKLRTRVIEGADEGKWDKGKHQGGFRSIDSFAS